MQAYYERHGAEDTWTEAWGHVDLPRLMRLCRASHLYHVLRAALPPWIHSRSLIVDAGCGPGAWVGILAEDGFRVEGVDDNAAAVRHARKHGLMVHRGDVRALPYDDWSVAVYLSLGVVEHDPRGPSSILREAARVVCPGGLALVSVPYRNGLRRLFAPLIRWRQRRKKRAGCLFYQYTFSESELTAALWHAGFCVVRSGPYGPTKMLRGLLTARQRAAVDRATAAGRLPWWKRLALRLFYTRVWLRLAGHMLLVLAVRRGE